jgi:hypothetical protein
MNVLLNVGHEHEATPTPSRSSNARLEAEGFGPLGDLGERRDTVKERGRCWGGTRHPEVNLYGAAYNSLEARPRRGVLEIGRSGRSDG